MTSEELANAVRSRFADQVASPESLTTIYDNSPTKRPTDGSTWCRFTILDGESQRVTVGVKEYRTYGVAVAQLFGRIGNGTKALRELADAVVTVFRDVSADDVSYKVPSIINRGETQDGWYQINVNCPFHAMTQDE